MAAIVAKTTELVMQQTIDIPRILVVPTGNVQSGFHPFTLKVDTLNYPPVSEELWAKHLRTDQVDVIAMGRGGIQESRLEDHVVSGLVDFDDVSYDAHADLLYDLASQVVKHLSSYLPDEHETRKVLSCYQRDIARFVHVQMQEHYWEKATGYEVKISKGFSELKQRAYTASALNPILNFRQQPADKSNMGKYLFGGFKRCLYREEKFQSDAERKLAVILDREATKWFKPAKGQFQIYYKSGAEHHEYQPDFVAETEHFIYMLEPKSRAELSAEEVIAKREAAVKWCNHASAHSQSCEGKPWKYVLIPHDVIAENITLEWLAAQFEAK
jgi:type III restriction enzyme